MGAETLGYDYLAIKDAPPRMVDSFCGVGNPFSLGRVHSGNAILDFGCGAGFDLFVASWLVGKEGKVYGVDLTVEMVELTRTNLSGSGVANFEIKQADSETIPFPDNLFDVVISNGVINLVPDKPICFREIYRVLKSGGRFQFADVVLERDLPAGMTRSAEEWAQ